MKQKLLLSTSLFFGIPLWVFLLSFAAAFIVAVCIILYICFMYYPSRIKSLETHLSLPKSMPCGRYRVLHSSSSLDKRLIPSALSVNISELEKSYFEELPSCDHHHHELNQHDPPQINDIIMKDGYLRRGFRFSLKELEDATNGFSEDNVVGSGNNGAVYIGLLSGNRRVVVKRLVCESCPPAEYFASQMNAIGRAKHKRLVKSLGYCTEGTYRMSVSEYVDNGNLHQWLHDFPGEVSPLTWTNRLHILHGVARGLAYLHEEAEPKILHGSIKSSNILLDHQWNPKISDYGLSKFPSSEWSHSIIEALGYVAPDCNSTRIFTEGSDIYGFGVLIMEIMSGRIPLHHSEPQAHIVDWFKSMIADGKATDLVDPKMPEMPSTKDLKRIILVALRCVDLDVNPKLKMGDVVCMLETNLILFSEHQIAMEPCERSLSPAGLEDTHQERNRRLSSSNH